MARPSESACTRAHFTDGVACLVPFDSHQRKALLVYYNVLELAALGGTNYIAQLGPTGTLQSAAACNLTLDPTQQELALLLINQGNADDAGATLPATQIATADAIACLKNFPPAMLDAMYLTLQCLLGRHQVMPQVDR